MTQTIWQLHPYPMTPFPIDNPDMAGLASVILRKRLDVNEEKWILDRLAKAQEFAHVPEDLVIEPRKPKDDGKKDGDESSDDEDEDGDGDDGPDGARVKVERRKGTLDEDQLAELWGISKDVVEEELAHVGEEQMGEESQASSPADVDMGGTGSQQQTDDASKNAQQTAAQQITPMMPLATIHRFMTTGAAVLKPEDK